MHSRGVEVRAVHLVSPLAFAPLVTATAILMLLLTPSRAQGQAEWNIGPFLTYSTIHGGRPASAGLQTGVLVGPIGLRASGFTALEQPVAASQSSSAGDDLPRWGGDADLMLIFDIASRGSGGGGLAPYVFAGAGLAVHNETVSFSNAYDAARVNGGWSYGAGILLPIGSTLEAMGEFRQRPAGFYND